MTSKKSSTNTSTTSKEVKAPMAPKQSKLAARLLGLTNHLGDNVKANPGTPIAQQRAVTMPGQMGAFRLDAQRYAEQIEALTKKAEEDRANAHTYAQQVEELQQQLRLVEQETADEIESLKAQLDEAAVSNTGRMEVPLGRIHKVPGRQRMLTAQQYTELRENLRNNKLITPITLRLRPDGDYDIISGHNRFDIFEELDRSTIGAVVDMDTEESDGDTDAFFANLFQPDLTDYEKYLGFKKMQEKQPTITPSEMAAVSGLSRPTVTLLMMFDELPAAALELVQSAPQTIGMTAVKHLVGQVRAGTGERVVEAIKKIVRGELTQDQAIKLASKPATQAPPAVPIPSIKIKAGKATYCDVRRAQKVLRLEFQSDSEAEAIMDELKQLLDKRAQAQKAKNSLD
ncbi:ParB/RepB/Spo0J family partition protein [Janthinobacterium sp. PSPC3-1]|uniref:ParB/RepB/Spo0J family partition protein n=1 Tax=Janthinobacterium sp. PSPC3-1 TaxID=2804653 RepID=UPI003CE86634